MRDRATRFKRALANEQRKFGHINDGAGKRYLIGPLYVLGGELTKALDFYNWYEKNVLTTAASRSIIFFGRWRSIKQGISGRRTLSF
jgi:hypothetical protein